MRLSATIQLAIAIFSLPSIAAPHGPVSIVEVSAEQGFQLSGPVALKNAYLKYNAEPPLALIARALTGSVTATPSDSYDTTYLSPVTISPPSAIYSMIIDTGGNTFSVYAPKLGTSGSVTKAVTIGGIPVPSQAVTLNNDASGGSNLVGMSYSGKTWYINAVAAGMPAVFTANLKKGASGTYGLGAIDTTAYSGTITYASVNSANGFWEFNSNGYAVGSGVFVSSTIDAIVDTGTTLLLLPDTPVTNYYKQVSGAVFSSTYGGYVYPCVTTLPNLVLGIGTYKATVPGSYLTYAPVSPGSSTCYGGLQKDTGIGFSIFGLPFIKSQFVVFKGTTAKDLQLGFAKKA